MATLKHTMELLVNPFFILLVLMLCSIFLLRTNKALMWVRGLLALFCCLLVLFGTGWFPKYLTQRLESAYPIVTQPNPQIKWVVVLGGGHFNVEEVPVNNLLSGASIKRLVEGVRLIRQLPDARLVLSGGGEEKNHSEAVLLYQLSQWFSIPEDKVVLEASSLNTEEQAKALVPILHKEPFYLVTSAIHMPRSMLLCQRQGLNPIAAPTDYTFIWHDSNKARMIIPNIYNFYYLSIAMHELLGRVWAKRTIFSNY
jgi:uncharacterized SAM-binding protein YcdF (DUF218 family)